MESHHDRTYRRKLLSVFLAITIVLTGLLPAFSPRSAEAAEAGLVLPNETQNNLASIFDYYYRTMGDSNADPNVYQSGKIDTSAGGIAGDGSDIVRLARLRTYIGAIVSPEKVNILDNDFELTFDLSMVGGITPANAVPPLPFITTRGVRMPWAASNPTLVFTA